MALQPIKHKEPASGRKANNTVELADQNAKIDYLAMMADIEFPDAGDSATNIGESEEE